MDCDGFIGQGSCDGKCEAREQLAAYGVAVKYLNEGCIKLEAENKRLRAWAQLWKRAARAYRDANGWTCADVQESNAKAWERECLRLREILETTKEYVHVAVGCSEPPHMAAAIARERCPSCAALEGES